MWVCRLPGAERSPPFSSANNQAGPPQNLRRINKEKNFVKFPAQGRCKSAKRRNYFSLLSLEHKGGNREHISGSVGG